MSLHRCETTAALVFVTAFDRYALQAFDTHATDCHLMPVAPERLLCAVQCLCARLPGHGWPAVHAAPQQLLMADRGQVHVVRCAEIESLRAADDYVELHLPGRMLLMRRTLAAMRPREKCDATLRRHSGAEVLCKRQHHAALHVLAGATFARWQGGLGSIGQMALGGIGRGAHRLDSAAPRRRPPLARARHRGGIPRSTSFTRLSIIVLTRMLAPLPWPASVEAPVLAIATVVPSRAGYALVRRICWQRACFGLSGGGREPQADVPRLAGTSKAQRGSEQ